MTERKEHIVFVVERLGVYGQGIVGVFATLKAAEEGAKTAKEREPDNYHEFEIHEFKINENRTLIDNP